MTDTFPKQVWTKLSAIDCSEQVQKKGQLSYLSWANAWTALMDVYPDSSYAFLDDHRQPSGTIEVHVSVCVSDGESKVKRQMSLPVMNYKNVAIVDPDARDISDARMRCLVKCIALFGLGLFLYRGEDIPAKREQKPEPLATDEQKAIIDDYIAADKAAGTTIVPPRRSVWVGRNKDRMTESQAATIIKECKES